MILSSLEHHKLVHALTDYDRKQSTKRGYNRYALAHYFAALQDAENGLACGVTRREAFAAVFTGALLRLVFRTLKLDPPTKDELR